MALKFDSGAGVAGLGLLLANFSGNGNQWLSQLGLLAVSVEAGGNYV